MRKPVAVPPGQGRAVENPVGGVLTFKVTAAESDGAMTALETVAAPGEGPPLHLHEQDEVIYMLEGTIRVKLGDELVDAPPDSFVFIPRGTVHTWQNTGAGPARFFVSLTPAATGFESFFLRYAELAPEERGPEAFARLAEETGGIEVVGPPL